MKFWFRACPRCGGDLELKPDIGGQYIECVQCGMELSPTQELALHKFGLVPNDLPAAPPPPMVIEGRRRSA